MAKKSTNKILDDYNRTILEELQMNARITVVELGKRISLSAPAVAERIKKLEDEGFIKEYRTVIDYDKIGLTVPVFINFRATKINKAELMKLIDEMPEVKEWYTITGHFCIMLKVIVSSTKELEESINRLQQFGETSTTIILESKSVTKRIKKES